MKLNRKTTFIIFFTMKLNRNPFQGSLLCFSRPACPGASFSKILSCLTFLKNPALLPRSESCSACLSPPIRILPLLVNFLARIWLSLPQYSRLSHVFLKKFFSLILFSCWELFPSLQIIFYLYILSLLSR